MIEEIFGALRIAKSAIEIGKEAKDLLPDGNQKEEISKKIEDSERDLALAEASTAKDLGYDLCQCTYPPQIMLYDNETGSTICPLCSHSRLKKSIYAFSD